MVVFLGAGPFYSESNFNSIANVLQNLFLHFVIYFDFVEYKAKQIPKKNNIENLPFKPIDSMKLLLCISIKNIFY